MFRRVALFYVASRVVLAALLLDRFGLHGRLWDRALTIWDGVWYLTIAQHGYPAHVSHAASNLHRTASDAAFFPLFPLVVRGAAWVTAHHWIAAGVLTASVFGLGACLALAALVRDAASERAGFQAGVLLAFAPGSFFLSLPYADGLAILLGAGFLLWLRRERWAPAAACGLLATATSALALPLVAVAVLVALRRPRAWLAALVTPLGTVGYFGYLWARTGTPFAWFDAERYGWGHHFDPLSAVHWFTRWGGYSLMEALSVLLALVGLWAWRRSAVPWSWELYSVLVLIGVVTDSALFLTPRFVMDAFGLTAGLGIVVAMRSFPRVLAASGLAMAFVALAYTTSPLQTFFRQP